MRGRAAAGATGWVLVFGLAAALIHMMPPSFFDSDTAYHLAVARITAAGGVLHAFPWTPYSWLADHYADKEFLFHLLLVPFSSLDPVTASRVAGAMFGTLLMAVLFFILRAEKVPGAGLWTLATLTISSAYLARFAMVRPHLLSIALSLLLVWAAVRRRPLPLAAAGFLFPLCYTAWHLPLFLTAVVVAAGLLSGAGFDRRGPLIVTLAALTGIALHPNFPEALHLFWIQNVEVLLATAWSGRGGIDLGGEFLPFSIRGLGRYLFIPAILTVAALKKSWAGRRVHSPALAFAACAFLFLLMTLRTQRFVEYLVPFALAAAALCWKELRFRALPALLILAGLLHTALFGMHPIDLIRYRTELFPPRIRESAEMVIPPGAQVVTCDWRFTGEMMLTLPGRRFIVALDPVFFAVNDPERYRIWYETVRNPPPRPAALLRDTFDAQYVMCTTARSWRPFLVTLDEDPEAELRAAAGFWRIYRLKNSVSP